MPKYLVLLLEARPKFSFLKKHQENLNNFFDCRKLPHKSIFVWCGDEKKFLPILYVLPKSGNNYLYYENMVNEAVPCNKVKKFELGETELETFTRNITTKGKKDELLYLVKDFFESRSESTTAGIRVSSCHKVDDLTKETLLKLSYIDSQKTRKITHDFNFALNHRRGLWAYPPSFDRYNGGANTNICNLQADYYGDVWNKLSVDTSLDITSMWLLDDFIRYEDARIKKYRNHEYELYQDKRANFAENNNPQNPPNIFVEHYKDKLTNKHLFDTLPTFFRLAKAPLTFEGMKLITPEDKIAHMESPELCNPQFEYFVVGDTPNMMIFNDVEQLRHGMAYLVKTIDGKAHIFTLLRTNPYRLSTFCSYFNLTDFEKQYGDNLEKGLEEFFNDQWEKEQKLLEIVHKLHIKYQCLIGKKRPNLTKLFESGMGEKLYIDKTDFPYFIGNYELGNFLKKNDPLKLLFKDGVEYTSSIPDTTDI